MFELDSGVEGPMEFVLSVYCGCICVCRCKVTCLGFYVMLCRLFVLVLVFCIIMCRCVHFGNTCC